MKTASMFTVKPVLMLLIATLLAVGALVATPALTGSTSTFHLAEDESAFFVPSIAEDDVKKMKENEWKEPIHRHPYGPEWDLRSKISSK
ncbi:MULTISPECIES: hypothetical protein [unclassified Frankia]|uniref:hypothetical protein n=1 Tax=unclassified Frankia TaxID=2632575 RepID=UPI001EF6334B|nr:MULTISPECIES: hypothetical protein [unclassified Frankia]